MFWVLGKAKDRLCDLYAGLSIQRNATVVAWPDFQTARGLGVFGAARLARRVTSLPRFYPGLRASLSLPPKANLHEYLRTVPDLFKEGISQAATSAKSLEIRQLPIDKPSLGVRVVPPDRRVFHSFNRGGISAVIVEGSSHDGLV